MAVSRPSLIEHDSGSIQVYKAIYDEFSEILSFSFLYSRTACAAQSPVVQLRGRSRSITASLGRQLISMCSARTGECLASWEGSESTTCAHVTLLVCPSLSMFIFQFNPSVARPAGPRWVRAATHGADKLPRAQRRLSETPATLTALNHLAHLLLIVGSGY